MAYYQANKLYFSILPSDLFPPLFLYFNYAELIKILPELRQFLAFNRLFNSKIFWTKIWKRDISSIITLPRNPYRKYEEIYEEFTKGQHPYDKVRYLAKMVMMFYFHLCCRHLIIMDT